MVKHVADEEFEEMSEEYSDEELEEASEDEEKKEDSVRTADSVIEEISGSIIVVRTMKGNVKFDIGKLFNIDQDNLSKEFATQASMYGFFAILAAEADRIYAMKTLLCEQEYAAADESYRAQMDLDGKKYTEAVVRSCVVRDEEYSKMLTEKENANYELDIIKAIVRAFEQRSMMLQSLGSHLRHEYEMQGMNIRERDSETFAEKSVDNVKQAISQRRRLAKNVDEASSID